MDVLVESCAQSSTAHKSRHRRACPVLLNQRAKLSLPLEEPYMHGITKGGKEKKLRVSQATFCSNFLSTYGAFLKCFRQSSHFIQSKVNIPNSLPLSFPPSTEPSLWVAQMENAKYST
jgi:hypothetical protein